MDVPHTVVELPTFVRQAEAILDDDERHVLIDVIASDPTAGDIIPGTGGARKLRVQLEERGKRGGARVIYYFGSRDHPVYLFAIYAKSDQADLTPSQRRLLGEVVSAIKAAQRRPR